MFPSNVWPRLDFSVFATVGQLSAAVSRDFEAKAPSARQMVDRLESGGYAVADGVISAPVRVFTPAFGAGATAGYAVMRIDPAIVSLAQPDPSGPVWGRAAAAAAATGGTTEDIRTGFGGQEHQAELVAAARPSRTRRP